MSTLPCYTGVSFEVSQAYVYVKSNLISSKRNQFPLGTIKLQNIAGMDSGHGGSNILQEPPGQRGNETFAER